MLNLLGRWYRSALIGLRPLLRTLMRSFRFSLLLSLRGGKTWKSTERKSHGPHPVTPAGQPDTSSTVPTENAGYFDLEAIARIGIGEQQPVQPNPSAELIFKPRSNIQSQSSTSHDHATSPSNPPRNALEGPPAGE